MKIKILRSGSKGNCSLLICNNTKIIIDIGINYKTLLILLEEQKINIKEINGLLITHTHKDHIQGLIVFAKKTNIKIFVPKSIALELTNIISEDNIEIIEDVFYIEDVKVELLHTSHDTPSSVGYVIEHNNKSLVYITDTGYINKKNLEKIYDKNIYVLESNHDEEMLMNGPYPYYLKQRVIGDKGHLSNKATTRYLLKSITKNTKYIVLAHISEKNNTKELALNTLKNTLEENNINKEVLIALQEEVLPTIEV